MQNFNFNHLYYFHVVASEGALVRAAKVLGVTQPTISEQIKQLETFLGIRLFDRRSGGGLRLNEAGRRVYEHTSIMFRTSNRLLAAFAFCRQEDVQVLDIGMAPSVARILAAELFLPVFEMQGIRPRIRIGEHDLLLHELVSLEVDFVLTDSIPPEPKEKGLEIQVIQEPLLAVVANPQVAARITRIPQDLDSIPFLGYTAGSRYRWEIEQYFHENGIRPELLGEVDDVSLMVTAAKKGLCFVIVPEDMASACLQQGSLCRLGWLDGIKPQVLAIYHADTPARVKEALALLTRMSD